ncbi:hypothetical protein VSX61_22305, partial [Brenneria populi subsp. brevivirga]|uniref:hypothetical protein n=1 Tax=Brenneria populi TaxID=1505588 RepID=UPI002E179C97|nr:hypothetical protein [Brenneria populi subsp. brevivirga]
SFYAKEYKDDDAIGIAVAKALFKRRYTPRYIVEHAVRHYTILKHNDNINVKCGLTYINLFGRSQATAYTPNKQDVCNVFVGSKFNEILKGDDELSLLKEMV